MVDSEELSEERVLTNAVLWAVSTKLAERAASVMDDVAKKKSTLKKDAVRGGDASLSFCPLPLVLGV